MRFRRQALGAVLPAVVALIAGTPDARAQSSGIDTLSLRAHTQFLSHDALGGRAIGSPGGRTAAVYIATELQRLGIPPADSVNGYLQRIPLIRADVDPARTRMIVRRRTRTDTVRAAEFYHLGGDSTSFVSFTSALYYGGSAGQAVTASGDRSLDGVTVVVRAGGAPLDQLVPSLEARKARAVIIIIGDSARYGVLRAARGRQRYFVRGGIDGVFGARIPVLMTSPRGARAFGLSPANSDSVARDLSATVRLETRVTFTPTETWNVAALLRGTGASRRDEAIIYTAHHDHIGIGPAVAGDSIYNGFIDDAVGVAAVLGIARALRASPPSRSVMFLLTGAEEQGSLGSAYYVRHPLVPLEKTVATINLDAGSPLAPPKAWLLEGGTSSTIGDIAQRLAVAGGWQLDLAPAQANSDHWSFLARQIPSVFVVPGEGWEGVTAEQENALIARWWRAHQPDDEWAADFPFAGLAAYARFAMTLGVAIANEREAPKMR